MCPRQWGKRLKRAGGGERHEAEPKLTPAAILTLIMVALPAPLSQDLKWGRGERLHGPDQAKGGAVSLQSSSTPEPFPKRPFQLRGQGRPGGWGRLCFLSGFWVLRLRRDLIKQHFISSSQGCQQPGGSALWVGEGLLFPLERFLTPSLNGQGEGPLPPAKWAPPGSLVPVRFS